MVDVWFMIVLVDRACFSVCLIFGWWLFWLMSYSKAFEQSNRPLDLIHLHVLWACECSCCTEKKPTETRTHVLYRPLNTRWQRILTLTEHAVADAETRRVFEQKDTPSVLAHSPTLRACSYSCFRYCGFTPKACVHARPRTRAHSPPFLRSSLILSNKEIYQKQLRSARSIASVCSQSSISWYGAKF